ncbi:hypothetical protein J2W40_002071 [Sphingobium xenophagum]|uniref:Uncharacterized protein n=1 Tax=Sphingobium xenophagum TaxID=121428 RepID=A0ABU1X1D4_SPHXE|nr:hypothetical protein [Sphingobium xenophagum]MDR7155249.1 hypothetical protein [Sphingobium xenophagum]
MKPAARRRVEREIREIMREDGEHCSICRALFEHNSRTYGGTTKVGKSVLAGECCKIKVANVVLCGLYFDTRMDDLVGRLSLNKDSGAKAESVDVERAVNALHEIFAQRQSEGEVVARKAGLKDGKAKLFTQNTQWKSDDAAWFESHPDRSHRLRPLIGDEAQISGFSNNFAMPDRHVMQILVRQVEPGKRMRLPFGRNLDESIPDDETVLHALFDIVSGDAQEGSVISTEMMRAAIDRYQAAGAPGSKQ